MVVGITGGSGSGKTTVSKKLRDIGAFIIDADKIAHEVIKKGEPAYKRLLNEFGEQILIDGEIDRKKLGAIVFSDESKLKILTSISHEYIKKEMLDLLNKSEAKIKVMDAPLLVDAELHKLCDKVIIVTADEEVRINRIMKRDSKSREEIKKILSKQMSVEKIMSYINVPCLVIDNSNELSLDDIKSFLCDKELRDNSLLQA